MRIENQLLSKFTKNPQPLSAQTIAVVSSADLKKDKWKTLLPQSIQTRMQIVLDRRKAPLKAGQRLCISGVTADEQDLWIAVLPENTDAFFLLEFARDSLKDALSSSVQTLRIAFLSADLAEKSADAFGAALATRTFQMPVFGRREKDVKPFQLKAVELYGAGKKTVEAFSYGGITGEGTNLARELATLPPNVLNPKTYGERIREVCKKHGIGVKFHSARELKKMGAGSFTAVDQGNPDSAGGIYELSYAPKTGKPKKTIHLVGKGLCFDTGGYDIKISGMMRKMKGDMQGSAVALSTLVSAAKMKLPFKMKAYLAVTENHVSPKAYKADEVVTALNGITIEVINTDAEGRMVLADTLTLASREKPDCLIDFATLTGSAIRAIGTRYSAGFTNREELHDKIRIAGRESGERVWTFPIDSTYAKQLESKIADTLQCVPGSTDHILASCFLSKFVEEGTRWVHIDLSSAENEGGLAHVDSLFTGFGVRWALEFMKRV